MSILERYSDDWSIEEEKEIMKRFFWISKFEFPRPEVKTKSPRSIKT